MGDGILPADLDGSRLPPAGSPEYFVGSMDDDAGDHAPFDALNVFQANVDWSNPAAATFAFEKSVPIAEYDTIFPCAPTARDCLPQPGITDPAQFLGVLGYRLAGGRVESVAEPSAAQLAARADFFSVTGKP